MLYGIQASKDVKLSNIARSLNEEIALIKTENRLSRHMAKEELIEPINGQLIGEWSKRIKGEYVTKNSPFVWATGAESLTDLNSLVTAADGFTRLTSAFGLNDDGIIVGKGEFENADRAFVAVPNP